MIGWIYQIRNIITGQRYIGSTTNLDQRKDRHFTDLHNNKHHNIYLQRSYNKYGQDAFVFEIVVELTVDDVAGIRLVEQQHLTSNTGLYNIGKQATGGDTLSNHPHKKEIQKRKGESIRQTRLAMSEQERSEKYGRHGEHNGMFGKTHTDEVKTKLSQLAKERMVVSQDGSVMGVIGSARKGKTNEQTFGKEKAETISATLSNHGRKRIGEKNPFFGKHHTDEYKQNAAERRKAKHAAMTVWDKLEHPQMKPICIDGILYFGVSEAAKALGCTPGNVTYKLKSSKYPHYRYLTKDEAIQYLQTMSVMKPDDRPIDPNSKISDNNSNEQ